MRISKATPADRDAATGCMVAAFHKDALLGTFFGTSVQGREAATAEFFGLLLDARLATGMPVILAHEGRDLIGVAMGNDPAPPAWSEAFTARLTAIEQAHPGLDALFAAYDRVTEAAGLTAPHYVLGVLAVRPDHQGKGVGKAVLQAFLAMSDQDETSQGTALETATPENLALYRRVGFHVRASGPVGHTTLWSMFRPKPARESRP